ncbi:MAG TPA: EAL domain-containing protein [Pseudomonadota bacterium]|jgi:EAL domain-containing protein (putative c-di-GMP-specific phosphodiesterase class I)/ActR/RegA family two-component response regulator|nr:EAL domain-containing protein [Pseudomonadota bacterium]
MSVSGETLSPIRVLVIDDEAGVRRIFARLLSRANMDVTEAGDGFEALALLEKEHFDVILSDITMPGLSGVALLEAVRQRDLTTQVIYATGNPSLETAMRAVELGAMRYLTKPIDHRVLVETVREAARLHRLAELKQQALSLLDLGHPLVVDRMGLYTTFQRVMDNLLLHFQPVVSIRRRRVWGYEALMRSPDPALPTPHAVLEAAEKLGELRALGRHVRQLAAKAALRLPEGTHLLVNLHPSDLEDPEIISQSAPLTPFASHVILEVTERADVTSHRELDLLADSLRDVGFGVAIDDLGAGYAGLLSFLHLRPTVAKLDMGLIRNIDKDTRRQAVTQSLLQLCRELDVEVIVEGIETAEERDILAQLGCDLMQGFLFCKPQPEFALTVHEGLP